MAVTARKVINRRVRYETEIAAQKKEGHPFFPYAMFHDTVVNFIIVLMIVAMATVWHATAGPVDAHHPEGQNGLLGALYEGKANPAVAVPSRGRSGTSCSSSSCCASSSRRGS